MNFSKFLWLEDVFMTGVVRERAKICHKSLNKMYLFKYKNKRLKSYQLKYLNDRKVIFWHGATLEDRKKMWEKWISYYRKKLQL